MHFKNKTAKQKRKINKYNEIQKLINPFLTTVRTTTALPMTN